jgi:hypothetical protein
MEESPIMAAGKSISATVYGHAGIKECLENYNRPVHAKMEENMTTLCPCLAERVLLHLEI